MRIMRKHLISAILALASTVAWAQDDDKAVDIKTTGYFILDMGYINEMQAVPSRGARTDGMTPILSEPFGGIIGGIRLSAQPMRRLEIMINPELKGSSIVPAEPGIQGGEARQKMKWDIYMEEARADWTFGEGARPAVKAGFGLMVYKENPDTRIFGEYLFRSMIYPALPFTTFNYPKAQLYGLHVENNLGTGFNHNLFLLSEIKHYPFYDLSLAYNASYNFRNMVEVGAGANLRSLIPVRPSRLTPSKGNSLDNFFIEIANQENTQIKDAAGNTVKIISIRPMAGVDSTEIETKDPDGNVTGTFVVAGRQGVRGLISGGTGAESNPAYSEPGLLSETVGSVNVVYSDLRPDTTTYSFAGTIVTGRISVNPLGFLDRNPLGKDALKLYAERAILGVKDYPGFYENIAERTTTMFGVNLPTLDFLDFLSFEAEYFPSKYMPSYKRRAYENIPQPGTVKGEEGTVANEWNKPGRNTKDDWKWGLAAKKTFNAFALVAQVGSDHTKLTDQNGDNYIDVMSRPAHWYMQFRIIGGIY